MKVDVGASQLLLIDWQPKVLAAMHQGTDALANAVRLAQAAHWLEVPTWGTQHHAAKLGQLMPELKSACRQTLDKMDFSAVQAGLGSFLWPRSGSNARSMPKHLRQDKPTEPSRPQLVLAGCEAHVCLLQTALDLLDEEHWVVWVVTDACTSRSERNRDAAFDRLAAAGAELVSTEMVLFEWLQTADHPLLKDVLNLVR